MLFFLSCPTALENEGDNMAGLHSACLCGFVVNSEQPEVQRHPRAPCEKGIHPAAAQGSN